MATTAKTDLISSITRTCLIDLQWLPQKVANPLVLVKRIYQLKPSALWFKTALRHNFATQSYNQWLCFFNQLITSPITVSTDAPAQKADVWGSYHSNPMQYLSILINLEYSLKCDAWVCTLASNTCRLIDELRATIGGKANYVFADLSKEVQHYIHLSSSNQHAIFLYSNLIINTPFLSTVYTNPLSR